MNYAKKELLHLRLMPDNVENIKKLAMRKGWTMNVAVDHVIEKYFEGEETNERKEV